MSHQSSPFEGTPSQCNLGNTLQQLHQSSTLENWDPPAHFATAPSTSISITLIPELVITVGSATNNRRFFYFEGLYDEYNARGEEDPKILKAFIKALTFRRCKAVELLQSVVNKILRNRILDAEDFEDLANLIADIGSKALLSSILQRTAGVSQRAAFYSHVMRCAMEQMNPADFQTAIAIVNEMSAVQAPWADATLYYFVGGLARHSRVCYPVLLRVLDMFMRRLQEPQRLDTTIVMRILAACERAAGLDVAVALRVLELIPSEDRMKCISMVSTTYECKKPSGDDVVYYVVDPLSVDVPALGLEAPQKNCFYLFLFSSLRSLCEKAQLHPTTHLIYTNKILPLRSLFERFPAQFIVVPPEVELNIRNDPVTLEAEASNVMSLPIDGGIAQIIMFAKCATRLSCAVGRSLRILSSNQSVIQELTPLTTKYPSSWFSICDKVCMRTTAREDHRVSNAS